MDGLPDSVLASPARTAPRRFACILNCSANSGRAEELRSKLAGLFSQHGLTATITVCGSGDGILRAAQQAVADGADVLVAAGGDGTVNAVASVVVKSQAALAVLPLGTLNHFARDNDMPVELEAAVAALATAPVTRVDAGEVNGHVFLNNSSIGLYPQVVRSREAAQERGMGKWRAFARAVLYVMGRYDKLSIALSTPGRADLRLRTPFLFIGNNRYQVTGLDAGSRQRLDSGQLWVQAAPDAGRTRLLWLALKTLLGLHSHREWHNFETGTLDIALRRRTARVSLDGEVRKLDTPLRYRILPGALKVLAPGRPDGTP